MERTALVLGAGGHAAIAWQIGIVAGLADVGVDLRSADLIVGTSAGAYVGAQLVSDLSIQELFDRQADPRRQAPERAPAIDFARWRADFMRARQTPGDSRDILRRFGALALQRPTDTAAARRTTVAARIPTHTWPERRLLIVAVDVESGERRAFERADGVDLVDAIAASSAVPGIWPPVGIGGRRYMDGGVYSIDNADLASGCDRVTVVTLPARVPPLCVSSLQDALDALRRAGAEVDVVHPDEASQTAFASVAGNLLDPAVRAPAALAGRDQGRRIRLPAIRS